jgi:hypothetical protein
MKERNKEPCARVCAQFWYINRGQIIQDAQFENYHKLSLQFIMKRTKNI